MKPTEITCPNCTGCGVVPFAKVHPQLARLCRQMYAVPPISAKELWLKGKHDCGVTAFNQRLEKLRSYGFAQREKEGRTWIYCLTEAGKEVARQ